LESAITQPIPHGEPTQTDRGGAVPEKADLAPTPSRWRPDRRLTLAGAAVIVAIIGGVLAIVFWPEAAQVIPPPGSETSASCHLPDAGTGPYSHWSIGANTSCGFGLSVAQAVNDLRQQKGNLTADFELGGVQSKATGKTYDMACVLDRRLVTCTGGSPTATIYIW
jgi:hypothetical protein